MAQELVPRKTDVIAPDDVVVLLDGSVTNAMQAMHTSQRIHLLNFRLLSLRPSELDDSSRVTDKISRAISEIQSGGYDAMFTRAAAVHPSATTPIALRDQAISTLRRLGEDRGAVESLITDGKQAVQGAHDRGIKPTEDAHIQAFRDILNHNGELFPSSMDRILSSERIPFLFTTGTNPSTLERAGCLQKPSDLDQASLILLPGPLSKVSQSQGKSDLLTFSKMTLDSLEIPPLKILSNSELTSLPGTDFTKVKYYMERKRGEVKKYNKDGRTIYMFPTENEMVDARKSGKIISAVAPNLFHDALATLSETNYLLEAHHDEPERSKIRDRFDTNIQFRDAALELLTRKVESHLQGVRLPPPDLNKHPDESDREESRAPISADAAIARADKFARSQLPSHYRLRSLFQASPNHPIVLKLTDDNGHTAESTITTFEPDASRALDIKRQVQSHLIDIPGIVPYRGPMKEASYNVGLDELIPSAPCRERILPKYGEYRLKLAWTEPREEMSISLGLNYSADNQQEAERRAAFVHAQLEQAGQPSRQGICLPITKRDLIDGLRNHVVAQRGRWEELTHGRIDQFPASLRLPFAAKGHDQDSWLQIEAMKTDGNPNLTWVLPMHVIVNGQKLANASTHINLHVRDRAVAEERAIDTVNRALALMNNLPPLAQWAVNADHPDRLQNLSEAARSAAPHLLDTNRLTDIQNELRSLYQKDLTVQVIGKPQEHNGKVDFTVGIFRGVDHGLMEPVLEQRDTDTPPTAIQRRFSIPANEVEQIGRFEQAVNKTFREVIGEEYDPRSSRNFDREQLRKLKTPRSFKPDFAPMVLDDAIGSQLRAFQGIKPVDPSSYRVRSRRSNRGEQGQDAGIFGR